VTHETSAPRAPARIRVLGAADIPRIVEIENHCFSTPWQDSTFRGLLRRKDTDLLGAEVDDVLVGYAIAWTVLDQAELGNVAVAPETRGLGVGRLLVQAILARLRHRRATECFLEVRESNTVAQRLYRQLGFEPVGRRKRYYMDPVEDALVMRVEIGAAPLRATNPGTR
jgi:[ribosomal protein S18]-alanine N-acetyltransferase